MANNDYQKLIRNLRKKFNSLSYKFTKNPESIKNRDLGLNLANGLEAELEGKNEKAYKYYSKAIGLGRDDTLARSLRMDFISRQVATEAGSLFILSFDQVMEDCNWQNENKKDGDPNLFHKYQLYLILHYYYTYRENLKGANHNLILECLKQKRNFDKIKGVDEDISYYLVSTLVVTNWSCYLPRKLAIDKFNKVNLSLLNYLSRTPNDLKILKSRFKILVLLFVKNFPFDNDTRTLEIIINLAKARILNEEKDQESYLEYALYLLSILGLKIDDRHRELITLVNEFCYRVNEINSKSAENLTYRAYSTFYYGMYLDRENIHKYFDQANDIFLEAESIDSKNGYLYSIWASCISAYAKVAPMNKKSVLYANAFIKYRKATIISPKSSINYSNWANTIIDFSLIAEDDLKQKYYYDASQKYLMSQEVGREKYGLSRAYALMNKEDLALGLLNTRLKDEEILPKHVIKDPAWKDYLDNPKFKVILDKYSK